MACQLSRPATAMRGLHPAESVRRATSRPALTRCPGRTGSRSALFVLALLLPSAGHAGDYRDNVVREGFAPPKHEWTKFVQVQSQPEPVPAEWVSTPEGQFAHSLKIPNPVPQDSGYRWWWSAKKYFLHLCETEAGEFVFKTADNVEGFLFMRPPKWPTDFDLKDRYKLEAPSFERTFQSYRDDIRSRGRHFVSTGRLFSYLEEPNPDTRPLAKKYLKASDYERKTFSLATVEVRDEPASQYGVTWRGLRRPKDRENGIAGTEVIVLDLRSKEVMAVWREFGLTGRTREVKDGVWWLNAAICPKFYLKYGRPEFEQKHGFVSSVLRPSKSVLNGR